MRRAEAEGVGDAMLGLCVDTGALLDVAGVVGTLSGGGHGVVADVAARLAAGAVAVGEGPGLRRRPVLRDWLEDRGGTLVGFVGELERSSSRVMTSGGGSGGSGSGSGSSGAASLGAGTGGAGTGGAGPGAGAGASWREDGERRASGSDDGGGLGGGTAVAAGAGEGGGGSSSAGGDAAAESVAAKVRRLASRAEWVADELRKAGSGLSAEEVDEAAALLACLEEKNSTTVAGITAVYTLARPAGWTGRTAKGEAAVVWRGDARTEKTIKQFLRVFEKVTAAAAAAVEVGLDGDGDGGGAGTVELVANAYEAGTGAAGARHDNARYTLALLLLLLGVTLRADEPRSPGVWLQPVDIHAATPSACVREWKPAECAVILSVKGPWPWGDQVRSAVTSSERTALAMSLARGGEGDGVDAPPVIGRLELQASEMLEQKKEKHVFLIGTTGTGKSTLGNLLVGEQAFHVDSTKTGTLYPQPYFTEWGLEKQVIWDTPGLSDGKNRDALFLSELALVVDRVQLAAAVILVIRSPARIPHSLVLALEKYIDLFGPQFAKVLYIVVNESSRVFPPEEIEMYNMTVAEQLSDELGLEMQPGFLLQIPTNRPDIVLPSEVVSLQRYNTQWLKQAVIGSRPVLTRMGHQTIESLLALRTTLDAKQQRFYRKQLLEQSGRQREGLQLLLSRADVRKAFFSKRGYILIQTWDLSASSRVLQVLQGLDSRVQQRRELRITPDVADLGREIANGLQLRKKHYTSRKEVRATTPDDVFSVLNDLGLVLIPLSVPAFSDGAATTAESAGESFAAARPGDRVSQRTLKAIADVLTNSTTSESVVRLVQTCMDEAVADAGRDE